MTECVPWVPVHLCVRMRLCVRAEMHQCACVSAPIAVCTALWLCVGDDAMCVCDSSLCVCGCG